MKILETTASEGSGSLALAKAPGFAGFYGLFGTGGNDMFFYHIHHAERDEWEIGTGHLQDAATLVRDTVIASSHDGQHVAFSQGIKRVMNGSDSDKD